MVVAFLPVGATSAFLLVVAGDRPRWTEYLGLVALYGMRGFGSLLIPRGRRAIWSARSMSSR